MTFQMSIDSTTKREPTKTMNMTTDRFTKTHSILKSMGYEINAPSQTEKALQEWSTEEFLFKTEYPISSVDEIDVFMSDGSWTVQGLSISKVTKINGYGEYGFYSGKYFLSLGKQYLCKLESVNGGHVQLHATNDTLHILGGKDSVYYRLKMLNDKKNSNEGDNTSQTSDPADDLYSFRIDIADQLDAGLESLIRPTLTNSVTSSPVEEQLAIEVEYRDKNGWTRSVSMPVLLSVLGQSKLLGDTVRTIGLAQRGDTLAFTARLPEYEQLVSLRLHVGGAARTSIALGGMKHSTKSTTTLQALLDKDVVAIAGISVYKGTCRMSNYGDGTDPETQKKLTCYSYGFAFSSAKPEYYFTTTIAGGYRVTPGTTTSFELIKYNKDSDDPLIATPTMGNFLVRIRTDQIDRKILNCNLNIQLTYQDYSGNTKYSQVTKAKEAVKNYIGYWPTADDRLANFGYLYGTSPGKYIEFPVTLDDAAAVTNVQISTDNISDEIQIAGISVSVLDSVGKRRIYAQTLNTINAVSNYRIVRTLKHTVIPPFPITLKLLFTAGKSYNITTGTGTVIPAAEPDYSTVRYSMSYEDTQRDFGFIRSKLTYDVTVKVANDSVKYTVNGDSGSRNQFYFQLQFKNGTSAFVLANQQLTSDGFRAGMEELFAIKVNRNYGDVTAIRIIPEDVSSESDVFDKLNIERITVTERTNGGAGMQYVFDNVGWIGIDYSDRAAQNGQKKPEGRMLVELASTYTVSYQQKVIYLYCEIGAWPWDVSYEPFEASIAADLTYLDLNDQPQTVSFDVVSRLYSYMNRTPRSYEGASDGSDQTLYNKLGTVTDSDYMLRPNHTDRFILPPLADVKTIKSMTLYVVNRSKGIAYWVISGISLSRIFSDSGTVILKQNGDHESDYLRNMQTSELCSMVYEDEYAKSLGMKIELPVGERVKREIQFSDSTITWSESTAWTSAVTRLPDSTNDTLNLYLYPTGYNRDVASTEVSAAFQYTLPFSKVMQVRQSSLFTAGSGTQDAMYYYLGVPASNMQTLTALGITCRNSRMMFDRAIVEQVRDNVIIKRYEFHLGGASATLGLKAAPSRTSVSEDKKCQNLMISFTENTREMTLFGPTDENKNVNDIAVAFQYKSSLSKNLPEKHQQKYYTPYVYFSDVGIQKIRAGMMAEIPFNIPYVSEITAYKIVSFGNITAEVKNALVANYIPADTNTKNDDGAARDYSADILERCYCINKQFYVDNQIREKEVMHDTIVESDPKADRKGLAGLTSLTPLELTFKTSDAIAGAEAGVDVPVTLRIHYTTSRLKNETMTIPDIRTFIEPYTKKDPETGKTMIVDNFITGESATIKLFVPDCNELTAFEISLVDETGTATWHVDNISFRVRLENAVYRRSVNMKFDTTPKTFSVRNVKLKSDISIDGVYKTTATESPVALKAEIGQRIEIRPSVELSENGYGYAVSWMINGRETDVTDEVVPLEGGFAEGFAFTPEYQGSVTVDTYDFTIWAIDNENIQNVISIAVPVPKNVETGEQTTSTMTGTSTSTSTTTTTTTTASALP